MHTVLTTEAETFFKVTVFNATVILYNPVREGQHWCSMIRTKMVSQSVPFKSNDPEDQCYLYLSRKIVACQRDYYSQTLTNQLETGVKRKNEAKKLNPLSWGTRIPIWDSSGIDLGVV